MATFRNRSGKWQARVQVKGHATLSKTFINKVDAERWAKQVEVEMQKGSLLSKVKWCVAITGVTARVQGLRKAKSA